MRVSNSLKSFGAIPNSIRRGGRGSASSRVGGQLLPACCHRRA